MVGSQLQQLTYRQQYMIYEYYSLLASAENRYEGRTYYTNTLTSKSIIPQPVIDFIITADAYDLNNFISSGGVLDDIYQLSLKRTLFIRTYIHNNNPINSRVAHILTPEEKSLKRKLKYQANKESILLKKKIYRDANKELLKEKRQQYNDANKVAIQQTKKEYYQSNKNNITISFD